MPESKIRTGTDTIASGTTTAEIDLGNRVLVAVICPASISSTTMKIATAAAAGGTYVNAHDGLGQYGAVGDITFTVAASKGVDIPPAMAASWTNIKLVFGSSESAKTFTYVTREI